ncbi:hypothetical protein MIMGU_mgv1a025014mg, partial [Erythranthe guttata]
YKPGGMWPIEDLKDPGVVSVAKFAVKEYNKKANTPLQLVTVIKGKQLMVAGSIYYLLILAKDKTAPYPQKYEVAVSDRPWEIKGDDQRDPWKSDGRSPIILFHEFGFTYSKTIPTFHY